MKLSIEDVDRIFQDSEDTITSEPWEYRTNRWQRHLMFARCVLGEDWPTSFSIATAFAHEPLPLEAMQRVAIGWADDPRQNPSP